MIKISRFIRNQIVAWKLIDDLLTQRIDEDNELEIDIYSDIQRMQSIALVDLILKDESIYDHSALRFWLNKINDPALNNNRIITIADRFIRIVTGGNYE